MSVCFMSPPGIINDVDMLFIAPSSPLSRIFLTRWAAGWNLTCGGQPTGTDTQRYIWPTGSETLQGEQHLYFRRDQTSDESPLRYRLLVFQVVHACLPQELSSSTRNEGR